MSLNKNLFEGPISTSESESLLVVFPITCIDFLALADRVSFLVIFAVLFVGFVFSTSESVQGGTGFSLLGVF